MTLWDRCGHPRTPDNSKRVGTSRRTGLPKMACRTCQRASTRKSLRKLYGKGGPRYGVYRP